MAEVKSTPYSETQRMRLRGLIRLSSEIIAHYWPMRNFVHHNPLHGLEHLPFDEAVRLGDQFLGGKGYLSAERYREYVRSGRILPEQIDAALKPLTRDKQVAVGQHRVSHGRVLRACLVNGMSGIGGASVPDEEILHALIDRSPDRSLIDALASHLSPALKPPALLEWMRAEAEADRAALVRRVTLSTWCDQVLGAGITDQINGEMIKWCGAFLDEGQAAWPMPGREKGFYLAWKSLAALEWSPCGIPESRRKAAALPEEPEEALIESLTALGIPPESWQEYLILHLAALPGWAGFIKWRADQTDYEWQQAYPADLAQYLAVRLWYVRELVEKQCREQLGIAGNVDALSAYMQRRPEAYFLRRARIAGRLPAAYAEKVDQMCNAGPRSETQKDPWERLAEQFAAEYGPHHEQAVRRAAALRLQALAKALAIDPAALLETPPEDLKTLLDWIDAFPESEQGPVWLKAFEAGYQEQLLNKLAANVHPPEESAHSAREGEAPSVLSMEGATRAPMNRNQRANASVEGEARAASPHEGATQAPIIIRPQAQAVFCIDVRSEPFRRHLEGVGDYETFGFAGFFTVFIRYQALGSHHETDQFPVIMKAKNLVRELPRPYQGRRLSRYLSGTQLLHMGHALLLDLKENVITPYVVVESVGWFYALPLIGKTVFTAWYRSLTAWLRHALAPSIATSLTIDKLSRKEVEEMIAAEQRGIIRRALQQQFGERDLNLSLERLESLRRRALEEPVTQPPPKSSRPYALSAEEETAFIEALRSRYQINRRGLFARMERITRTGFTLQEQLFTVETALRMMGLTRNFARLVLFCGHGSASENNPFEAALDCGACGGNSGKPNARVLAAMANKPLVREGLAKNGITIPADTYFIAGEHNTTTDEVELFDLEDLPQTHQMDLRRLMEDLEEAGLRNNRERCARLPEIESVLPRAQAAREVRRRSGDWSQVRPEWGLSGNAAFIIGRRELTQGVNLEGRVFLQSYDYREDASGQLLEILMTGPQVVGQWISMEHYFSTVDNEVYGSGSKIYHNVVGRFGIMSGPQSDLRGGLAAQTVMKGERPYHEPMRLLSVIEAPRERIGRIIPRHKVLLEYYDNEWVRLFALDPEDKIFYLYIPKQGWVPLREERPTPQDNMFLEKEQRA